VNVLLVPAHPGFPGQIPQSRKTVVCVCVFSETTWVSQYQKGRNILDFNEARDDRAAVASSGTYANHLQFTPDR